MKIIFLDVDGVLNSRHTKEKIEGYIFVEDRKILLLKQIIDQTAAKVVLTSTWRHGWPEAEMGEDTLDARLFVALRDKLLEFGIELFGYTPITNKAMNRRGEEIDLWLKSYDEKEIEGMVILDDLNCAYLRPHSRYAVRTSFDKGLEEKHLKMAENVLKMGRNSKNESCSGN